MGLGCTAGFGRRLARRRLLSLTRGPHRPSRRAEHISRSRSQQLRARSRAGARVLGGEGGGAPVGANLRVQEWAATHRARARRVANLPRQAASVQGVGVWRIGLGRCASTRSILTLPLTVTVTVTLTRTCAQVQGASKAAATDGGYEHGRCVVAAAGARAAQDARPRVSQGEP